jgi:hypothetical protein
LSEALEQHEHAEHAAEGGRKNTALLIAALAAGLAFAEQGAQHANTRMASDAIAATDLWAQYQAKSIRATNSKDMADLAATMGAPDTAARDALVARLKAQSAHFETDPKTGKTAIAAQAHALEESRDGAHERLEGYDNASAALQLAIVLVTASVITGSVMLVWIGGLLGVAGGVLALLALLAPQLAAF